MKVSPRFLLALLALLVVVGSAYVLLRPTPEPLLASFPGGKLEKTTFFDQGGKITEVREFSLPGAKLEEVRTLADEISNSGRTPGTSYGVGFDGSKNLVTVYSIRPSSRTTYFFELARSGGKTKMYGGPVVVGP
jgi:hypothetical protein